jgi:hypothetical protein
MKTVINNSIYFSDGLDTQFCQTFRKIFPDEYYLVNIFDFSTKKSSPGHFYLILEIEVSYNTITKLFTYEKLTTDMPLIDGIRNEENEKKTDLNKRRCIVNMITDDNFIEQLDEFLDELENSLN